MRPQSPFLCQDELPQGLRRINAPTPFVRVIGQTRTDGLQDYGAVHKVEDGYKLTQRRTERCLQRCGSLRASHRR